MPVEQFDYTRHGIEKNGEIGTNPLTGKSRCNTKMIKGEAPFMQKVKEAPVKFMVEFDRQLNGEAIRVTQVWGKAVENPDGLVDESKIDETSMLSIPSDVAGFCLMYEAILYSMLNGKVEGIDGFVGKKVFDSLTKALLTFSEEQENEPPTFDYWPTPEPTEPA